MTIALAGCVEGGSENEDGGIGAVGANAPAVGASGGDLPPVRVRPSLLDYGRVAPSTTVTGTVILSNFFCQDDVDAATWSTQCLCSLVTFTDMMHSDGSDDSPMSVGHSFSFFHRKSGPCRYLFQFGLSGMLIST